MSTNITVDCLWQRWTYPSTRRTSVSVIYCKPCLLARGPVVNGHDVRLSPSKARGRYCFGCRAVTA